MVTKTRQGVRCPHCHKKIGDILVGTLHLVCPRCKKQLMLRSDGQDIDIKDVNF